MPRACFVDRVRAAARAAAAIITRWEIEHPEHWDIYERDKATIKKASEHPEDEINLQICRQLLDDMEGLGL